MVLRHITTAQFSALVTCLSADKANNYPAFLKPLGTLLFNVVHHYESLGAMIYYWHYLSYHMLDYLSESLNLEDVQEQFQEYKDEVHMFKKQTTLIAFSKTEKIKRVCPPCFKEIVTQFLWPDTATLELLEEFRNDYLRHYDLHSYSMILGFVELLEPSHFVSVTWFVPRVVAVSLMGASPESLKKRYSIVGNVKSSQYSSSSSRPYFLLQEQDNEVCVLVKCFLFSSIPYNSCCRFFKGCRIVLNRRLSSGLFLT